MKKLIAIFSLLVLLASCSKRHYPSSVDTVIKETVTTDTVYVPKETVVTIPGDTVEIYEAIPCPDVIFHKEATSKTGNLKAVVNISKGNLTVDCKTDSLQKRIQWLEANSRQLTVKEKIVTITPPPKRFIPKWVWWLLGLNIVYIGLRVVFKMYKIPISI